VRRASFVDVITGSAERTRSVGSRLGELAAAGDVILLVGPLGAGKTCLTQGIALGLGVVDNVVSPTFVLLREYQGRLPLYHLDFYRLDSIEEISSLGLEDYLFGPGVCVVEWAEKGLSALPREHLLIEIERAATSRRRLRLRPSGARYEEMLSHFESAGIRAGK
jgi:tRNA threonylcarbamoyladenosine biosynthesis protein TsaE